MTRTNFDPPSEPPDGVPTCHQHDLPMEYDPWMKEWYCPDWHERPLCPVCGTELLVDDVCPACTERNEEILKIVLGDEPYPDDLEACYQNREMRTL